MEPLIEKQKDEKIEQSKYIFFIRKGEFINIIFNRK